MKNTVIANILLLISMSTFAQNDGLNPKESNVWTFEHYPAVADFSGSPAKPLLITPHEHAFRTMIRTQALNGPNFAGHYTVAKWGCGSPCLSFVIIDAKSGAIYDPGFSAGCANSNGSGAGINFKLTSRLIIVTGLSKESKEVVCGDDFYQWDGKRLKWIHFEPWPSNH
ncbi:MAG TPA: hypothetical protein VGE85_18130 [Terracidiphilus sp.]|jgi:hypothetical protein